MSSSSNRLWAAGFSAVGLAVMTVSAAIASSDELAELSVAESELVEIRQAYKDAQKVFWGNRRQYQSSEEVSAAYVSGELVDPDVAHIPKLLEYEASHRGEEVGINALMHVFSEACRGGDRNGPRFVGSREAATRLKHYTASPLLPRAVGRASCFSLQSEPLVRTALRDLHEMPELSPENRDVIGFYLAKTALEINRYLPARSAGLAKLESGETEPQWPGAISAIREEIAGLPSIESAASEAVDALETLRQLAAGEQSPRLLKIEPIDPKWNAVRAVDDPGRPRLSKIAAALLFKEEHLVVEAVAPALEVELLDGTTWKQTDQQGKVVVIQFSFTGCGPCERMYPDLADLTEEHGDRLEVLTLMRDETPEYVEKGVEDGKFNWSVALDGKKPGRIASKWSVDGFPEVYVIDKQGKIAAIGLRGDSLRKEIERLLANEG